MFTVVIAEKKQIDAIGQNRLFFKPFLDKMPCDFAFCEWNPTGQTLYESVPDLVRTVGRRKSWRAILICDCLASKTQKNPFDQIDFAPFAACEEKYLLTRGEKELRAVFGDESAEGFDLSEQTPEEIEADNTARREAFKKWSDDCAAKNEQHLEAAEELYRASLDLPLQRLATCLCYVPESKTDGASAENGIDKYVHQQMDAFDNVELVREEFLHRYKVNEDAMKARLRYECIRQMLPSVPGAHDPESMGISLPDEVYCITERITENGFFDPNIGWQTHTDFDYSSFADRNMYFDKMRFLVFDQLPEGHQDYRYNRIRFLYALLILAVNEIPREILLPRKLYLLETENSEQPLRELITSYCTKLDNTVLLVDEQIDKICRDIPGEISDSDAQSLFCAKIHIPVEFDKDFKVDAMYSHPEQVGFASDCPESEKNKWQAQYLRSCQTLDQLVKQPRRSVKKAVDLIEPESNIEYNRIRALNSFQMDDIRDYTEDAEDAMVNVEVSDIFDIARFHKQLESENEKVERVLERRMKRKTTILLGGTCLALLLIGCLPLLFNNFADFKTVPTALVMIGGSVGLLAVCLVIALYCLRIPVKNALRSFNDTARGIVLEVRSAMTRFSDYLSCVCNVRRGYRAQFYSERDRDCYDRSIRTRKKHWNDMRRIRADVLEKYGEFYGTEADCDEILTAPYEYDFGREDAEYSYAPPYLKESQRKIDYLERGNTVTVPSSFVTRVSVRMEEIYDQ